jgi:surface protein
MDSMFSNAIIFNGFINFNTSSVLRMAGMFRGCSNFNRPISWDTSRVMDMAFMFDGATNFNQNIRFLPTNSVTDMSFMFRNARNFNQPIDLWNTSNVTNMNGMFQGATSFNQNINTTPLLGGWNTRRVTNMERMFEGATSFNNGIWPPVTGFNGFLSEGENTVHFRVLAALGWGGGLFELLQNQAIFNLITPRQTMNWEVRQVVNFNFMFNNASSFINVDLRRWNIINHSQQGFRSGNCPMLDTFTPQNIWLFSPNRGR